MTINRRLVCFSVLSSALLATCGCGSGKNLAKNIQNSATKLKQGLQTVAENTSETMRASTNELSQALKKMPRALTAAAKENIAEFAAILPAHLDHPELLKVATFQLNGEVCYDIRFPNKWVGMQKDLKVSTFLASVISNNHYDLDGNKRQAPDNQNPLPSHSNEDNAALSEPKPKGIFAFCSEGADFHLQITAARLAEELSPTGAADLLRNLPEQRAAKVQAQPVPSN